MRHLSLMLHPCLVLVLNDLNVNRLHAAPRLLLTAVQRRNRMAKHVRMVRQLVLLVAVVVSSQSLVQCHHRLPGLRGKVRVKRAQRLDVLARLLVHVTVLCGPVHLRQRVDRLVFVELRDVDLRRSTNFFLSLGVGWSHGKCLNRL